MATTLPDPKWATATVLVSLVLSPIGATASSSQISVAVLGVGTKGPIADLAARFSAATNNWVAHAPAYRLVPSKSLDEVKLIFGCFDEASHCMIRIGRDVRAHKLVWGRLERSLTGFTLELLLLDVSEGRISRRVSVVLAEADVRQPAAVLARLLPRLLTARSGLALVASPAPGVRTPERAAGFDGGLTGGQTGWKLAFWVSLAATASVGVALIPNGIKVNGLETDKDAEIERLIANGGLDPDTEAALQLHGCDAASVPASVKTICDEGATRAVMQNVLIGVGAGLAALSAFFAYKAFGSRSATESRVAVDVSTPPRRSWPLWSIVPAVGPDGAAVRASLRF